MKLQLLILAAISATSWTKTVDYHSTTARIGTNPTSGKVETNPTTENIHSTRGTTDTHSSATENRTTTAVGPTGKPETTRNSDSSTAVDPIAGYYWLTQKVNGKATTCIYMTSTIEITANYPDENGNQTQISFHVGSDTSTGGKCSTGHEQFISIRGSPPGDAKTNYTLTYYFTDKNGSSTFDTSGPPTFTLNKMTLDLTFDEKTTPNVSQALINRTKHEPMHFVAEHNPGAAAMIYISAYKTHSLQCITPIPFMLKLKANDAMTNHTSVTVYMENSQVQAFMNRPEPEFDEAENCLPDVPYYPFGPDNPPFVPPYVPDIDPPSDDGYYRYNQTHVALGAVGGTALLAGVLLALVRCNRRRATVRRVVVSSNKS